MVEFINRNRDFAGYFNTRVSGAPYQVTSDDIAMLVAGNLIHRYGFFSRDDLDTVRVILQYVAWFQVRTRPTAEGVEAKPAPPRLCKLCGCDLPEPDDKKPGRPPEYCPDCRPKPTRARDRRRRSDKRKRRLLDSVSTLCVTNHWSSDDAAGQFPKKDAQE